MDACEGRLWVLNHEPYLPGHLSKLLLFLVKHVIINHIKQDIFLAFQTGGCLLLHESSAESSCLLLHESSAELSALLSFSNK